MTVWISQQLLLFNFKRLDILLAWIKRPSQKLWSFEFALGFYVYFQASWYTMCLNWTFVWKVMTIWISRDLPLFNFQCLDILCLQNGHPFEKIGPFEYLERLRCTISSVTIYYALESDIRVKSYDHLNFSRVFVVQFRTSRYIMSLNRTYVWNVMTISISREVSLYNFEMLEIKHGSATQLQTAITFDSDVWLKPIIYREAWNWTMEALDKFKWL